MRSTERNSGDRRVWKEYCLRGGARQRRLLPADANETVGQQVGSKFRWTGDAERYRDGMNTRRSGSKHRFSTGCIFCAGLGGVAWHVDDLIPRLCILWLVFGCLSISTLLLTAVPPSDTEGFRLCDGITSIWHGRRDGGHTPHTR